MKLINAYINNFGKLSDYNHDFNGGINVIEKENGWGKTTFAAFLKAMLFGMDVSRSKINIVDRTRYLPWQGGDYGGNLTYETNGKQYRIERSFGTKKSDDVVVLYDLQTKKEVDIEDWEYGNELGNTLWNVDRDSYEKTAFITLGNSELLSDIISGRLGNIKAQKADMETSSNAIIALDEAMKSIKSTRKGSSFIYQKKSDNQSLKEELKSCQEQVKFVELNETWIREEQEALKGIEQEELILETEQMQISLIHKRKQLDALEVEVTQTRGEYEEEKKLFKSEISDDMVDDFEKLLDSYKTLQSKLSEQRLGVEEQELYEAWEKKYVNPFGEQGEMLTGQVIDRYMDDYNKCCAMEEKLKYLELDKGRIIQEQKDKRSESATSFGPVGILGAVGIVVGAGLAFLIPLLGAAIAFIGCGVLAFQLIQNNNKKKHAHNIELEYREKVAEIEREIATVKLAKVEKQQGYMTFLRRVGASDQSDVMKELLYAKMELEKYIVMRTRKHQYKIYSDELSVAQESMDTLLDTYCENITNEYGEALDIIKQKRTMMGVKKSLYERAVEKYDKFQKEQDIPNIKSLVLPEQSEEELRALSLQKRNAISEKKRKVQAKIAGYQRDIDYAQNDIDKIMDIESEIECNNIQISEKEEKYRLLSTAKQGMTEAKTKLAVRYMEAMSKAFKSYLEYLGQKDTDKFEIDVDLNVQFDQQGKFRESDKLSKGKQDLVQICMRMALVDAVYKDVESPILILDDPFVNLDEASVTKGIQLLEKVSEKYQIIYFVCHGSRAK